MAQGIIDTAKAEACLAPTSARHAHGPEVRARCRCRRSFRRPRQHDAALLACRALAILLPRSSPSEPPQAHCAVGVIRLLQGVVS